jgi:hypothetical protein
MSRRYRSINNVGSNVQDTSDNPLNYCLMNGLDSSFNNGPTSNTICNANSKNCQSFMSDYCSKNWNNICEFASNSSSSNFIKNSIMLTTGELLLADTASKKYLSEVSGCCLKYEQFDPTVASSPLISFWSDNCGDGTCVPVYEVDPKTIDSDPVMNKILDKPTIAWAMLLNIYNTAVRKNTINLLKDTRLYNFFYTESFQKYINSYNTPVPNQIKKQRSQRFLETTQFCK